MIKYIKKAVSALLASIMCIPVSGIVSIANAAEMDNNGDYTVTLSESEGGFMQFTDDCLSSSSASQDSYHMVTVNEDGTLQEIENDGTVYAFQKGDNIEIELIPDDGFSVKSFEIRDVNTNRVMAQKDTTDNFFQFIMPGRSIVVSAEFSDGSISSIPIVDENDKQDSDEPIEYHDVTESESISKEEVEEVVADIITESYIKSHLNNEYVTVGNEINLANILCIKNTMFDGAYVEDDDTINSIMYSISNGDENMDANLQKVISQVEAWAMVYDFNKESDYYVAYANTLIKDDNYTVQDWEFAIADESGTTVDGCIYDADTGLVYIPKELYNEGDLENILMYIQVQFMQVYHKRSRSAELDTAEMDASLHTLSVDADNETIELHSSNQKVFSCETVVNVASGMNENNINVIVNGILISKEIYKYDSASGTLTIAMSPAAVVSVEVSEGEETLSDKLLDFMTDDVQAAYTVESMEVGKTVNVDDPDDIPNRGFTLQIDLPIAYINNKTNASRLYIIGSGRPDQAWDQIQKTMAGTMPVSVTREGLYYDIKADFSAYPTASPYSNFFQQLGEIYLLCAHIKDAANNIYHDNPIGSMPGGNNVTGKVFISVLEKDVTVEPNEDGTNTINGYVVLGFVTAETHGQTGIGYLKVGFGTPPPPPIEIEQRDPLKLYIYKVSSMPGAELKNSATLAGAKFEILFYNDVEYTSVEQCLNATATTSWIFQTKQDDRWVGYFPNATHTGYIDIMDSSYLAPESPEKDTTSMGYTGSYLIREIKNPDGFLLEGYMQDYVTGNGSNDVKNGLVYYINVDDGPIQVKCNGQPLPSGINGIEVGAIPNQALIVAEKPDIPNIETQSMVEDTGTQYGDATSHNVVCIDDIHLYNLRESTLYTLETYLADLSGNKIAGTDTITTMINTSTLSTKNYDARISITIDPVSLGLANQTIMFVNKLYDPEQSDPIAVDSGNMSEYIYFPNSGTLALDRETGKHITYTGHNTNILDDPINIAQGTERATVTDKIWYQNLQVGRTYEIRAWMVDCDTGSAADDGNGSPIVISDETKYFTTTETDGTVDVTFTFDVNQSIAGRKYVIFSEIYLNNELVASHKVLGDQDEMIWLPKITTNLTDDATGTDITYANGTVRINDQVDYTRLLPGETYMVKGTLYNMNTNEVLLDDNGNEVTTTKTFTTTSENGTIDLNYVFPADTLGGTVSVSYVELYVKSAATHNQGDWVLIAEHKDYYDENQRNYMPVIDTTALDQKTAHHISYAEKTMKIYDIVHYEALHPEYTYKLVSELRDVATGEIVVDDAGVRQVVTSYFKADFDYRDEQYLTYGDVIPENLDGSGITFDVDAEFFAGRTLVVYERLYLENEHGAGDHLIAEHQELLDSDQTIHVPKIWTSAIDSDTFTKTSFADNSTTIIDTVSYENLIPDLTYELKGYIIDKNQTIQTGTNVVATGTNGKLAENSMVFTPESSNGAVKLSFNVDTSMFGTEDYNGMIFVVYEELYVVDRYDDADHRCLVATHTDIADVNQTVYVPRITTSLNEKESGSKILPAVNNAHLVDTINYFRFQPSADYVIKGKLIDMETGNVLIDSRGNRVETTVTVTSSATGTGIWTVDYEFDATEIQGKIIVAYADVYVRNGEREDILSHVASHNDFWDEEQRVYIPVISTVATDQKTNSHITFAEDNVWITDRIYYSFLQPNTEYKLVSKLVDKSTGEVVVDDKGIPQVIESTFTTTPNESQERYNQIISNPFTDSSDTGIGYSYGYVIPADGTTLPDHTDYHGVVFGFDAHTFEGRTLVIYEELQVNGTNGYTTVASHTDLMDENQTIHLPKIRTNAVDSETLTHTSKMDGQMTIIDTVSYENLIPGFTYVLEGYLMDKPRDDTKGFGKIKDKDGNYITNRIEFTPDKPNGTVQLSLSGNASEFQTDEGAFSSETLVVFERLYLKDNKDASDELLIVANHEDINDEKQTIYCPRITTKIVAYDLGEEAKDGEADHVLGVSTYKCSYCNTNYYSEFEVQRHIEQTAICKRSGAVCETVTEATIYDRVYYENLIPNRTYTVVGHLIDTKTGKSVLINQRAVQSEEKYFTPGSANGEVDVVFHVTGIDLAGGRYVAYEELFLDGVSIAEHKDKFDRNQTFYVPKMATSVRDVDTGKNITKADTISTIIDTVEMSGLKEGQNYYLRSSLIDSTIKNGIKSENHGAYYIDGTGNIVSAKEWRKKGDSVWHPMDEYFQIDQTLSDDNYRGTVTIEVKFEVDVRTQYNGKNFEGTSYTVFQELYTENGTLVGQHKDINDSQQTIYIGEFHTVALDKDNGTHLMDGTTGKTIVDTIYYSNLEHKTYKVIPSVYVKEKEEYITPTNMSSLSVQQYVASESGAGKWEVSISLPDLTQYQGCTLVVLEEIRDLSDNVVASEKNIYNEAQSIHIPKVTTNESDDVNGTHYTLSEGKWVCDNYDCKAEFTDKSEAELHIMPIYQCDNCKTQFRNIEDVESHINGNCRNATVFKDSHQLIRDDNNNVVVDDWFECSGCGARFKTNQECLDHINGSDVCYTYTDINADHHSYTRVNASITDTVTYTNVIPGKEYAVVGSIINVDTDMPALDANGDEIKAQTSFVPMSSRGTVKVKFEFDGTLLAGDRYVVFEQLQLLPDNANGEKADNIVIGKHEDKNDKNQVFYVPSVSTAAIDKWSQTNVTKANSITTLVDTVTYYGLNAGNTSDKYIIEGIVMDADTMKPLVLADGNTATAKTEVFTARGTEKEQKQLEFTFSTSALEGKTLVVFEKLYLVKNDGNVLIGQHTEIMDEKQTTHIPMIRTFAYNEENGEQVAGADDSVTIIDKVVCTNLVPGKRYKLEAKLVNPLNGTVLKDVKGHDIVGTLDMYENNYNEFTVSSTGRTVRTVKFVFDGSNLAGQTAVVHETLYMEGTQGTFNVIAQHCPLPNPNNTEVDLDYRNQRIDFPAISTTVKDKSTNSEFVKDSESAKIIDTVSYTNLTGGLEYKLVGKIYDVKHDTFVVDAFGHTFTSTKYFMADNSGNGTVNMEFVLNTKDMVGNDFVVFEELFLNDASIATHADKTDVNQTFKVPTIHTSVIAEDIPQRMTMADNDAVIIDTVTFENLVPDREYTVKGVLMDKSTGKALVDTNGNEVKGETTFKPTTANGTVNVQFRFNASEMEGVVAVAYENLFYAGASIAEHRDLKDEEQTIYFPVIKTLAKVNETANSHVGSADAMITITDTVTYDNLIGDESYHVQGWVIDTETGKPALDANGNEIHSETTFQTAHPDPDANSKAVSGSVDLVFEFDATGMRNKTLVIYESVYYHKNPNMYLEYKVAEHNDIADEKQRVHIPEIGTSAWDSETRHHITKADDNATIIDTVSYKNLVPGLEYTVEGFLRDLDNNGEVAVDDYGLPIHASTTFIPKDWNGNIDVRFSDLEITKLAGHTLVAYEYLYYNGVLIEHHDNPEDQAQMIHLPRITTSATDFDSNSSNAMANGYVTVIDTVEYFNLIPELEYSVIGLILDKETGEPARDADGNYIKGSAKFTPNAANGTVDVSFKFKADGMEDTQLVVFEEVFYKGNLSEQKSVAEHSDLIDESQSVYIPKITTSILDDNTSLRVALASDNMSVTDTVRYKGLVPNTNYRLVGKLYDKATGNLAVDDNGNAITASTDFTVTEKQGYKEVTFTFNGKNLEGHTIVATEELYVVDSANGQKKVAEHIDLNDIEQTLYIPKARTIVKDKETNDNYSKVGNMVTVTDTVSYENLVPGYSYTAKGVLVDRETQEPVHDVNGNEIKSETAFVVNSANGEVEVTFTFDATGFDGLTYNAFETITCNGKVVAEHKDVNDDAQNIHFPKVNTEAYDTKSELQLTLAEEKASVVDIIYYENLKPGVEYTVTGKLVDKTTGMPVMDPTKNINPDEVLDKIVERWVCDNCSAIFDSQEKAMNHVDESSDDNCSTYTLVLSYDADDYNELIEASTLKVTETFVPTESTGHIQMTYNFNSDVLAGHTIVAYATLSMDGVVLAEHTDINDEAETIYIPQIGTIATDAESGLHVSKADSEMVIADKVEYQNLVPNMNYLVKGYLMDKATGEKALDANGNEISAETEFQPTEANGYVTVTFRFNGSNLKGKNLVAYEYLTVKDGENPVVAKHENIDDEEQSISIPKIETKAFDSLTNENIVKAGENTTIIDRVYYQNLTINQTYTVSGILVDKATGKTVLDVNNKEVRGEKTFTARDHDGYVDVEFVFNAKGYSGKTLVAYEELFQNGYSIASHEDINDEKQTVYLPKITTTALDKKTNTHMAYADDKITIVDTVTYTNVAPNAEYTLVGTLMDGESGTALTQPIEKKFTTNADNGTQNMEFTVDATTLKGKKVVVYEELKTRFVTDRKDIEIYTCNQCGRVYDKKEHAVWHFEDSENCFDYSVTFKTEYEYGENVTIAEHKDIESVEQTVYVPEIFTTAIGKDTNEHIVYAGKNVVVIDKIRYNALQTGIEYEVVGTLMDKETQKPVIVDGKEVTASAKFTPSNTSGTTNVTFTFNANGLDGKTLVAYEKLYVNGSLIANHEDINDKEQSIYIPQVNTNAVDQTTNEHIGLAGETTIVDAVEYKNLVPGFEYTVKGILMDKSTGKAYTTISTSANDSVVDAVVGMATGGNKKEYTAEMKFTPSTPNGKVELKFEVNVPANTSLVVFEEIFLKDILVANHKDINDTAQTVQYPEIRTNATSNVTGTHTAPSIKTTTITDEVTYSNLVINKEYTISGELMDKETGKDTGIKASKTFIAEKANGSIKLEFVVDTSVMAGKSLVAYETLTYNGKVLAIHQDLTDADQTVNIPEIATNASDKLTQTQVVSLGTEVVVVDVVTYHNLTTGIEYTMRGTLMLVGKDDVKSTDITAEKKFTPSEKDGKVELEFKVDSTKYAGAKLVAYEKLFEKEVELVKHENPEDEKQTVYVPVINTKASIGKSDVPTETKIVDVVTYKNLVSGISYSVKGTLMDKATGKELLNSDGKAITASKTFIPEKADGEVEINFVFNTSVLNGKTDIVVFEEMILNDHVVAEHRDINDASQTVKFTSDKPSIKTVAKFDDGQKEAKPQKNTVIVDTVTYENLTVGTEYILSGKLVSKKSGKAISVNGKAVESVMTFTPDKPNGSVEMKFTFNSSAIKEEYHVVVFEKLTLKKDNTVVAEHQDLTDTDQTVVITPTPNNPVEPDKPYISTTAKFGDGTKETKPNKNTVIVDTVSYRNLTVGTKYVLTGKLVSKTTGKTIAVNGKAVENRVEFTPDKASGSIDVTFNFDTSAIKSDYEIVVFETLASDGNIVAKHEDIKDANQTVKITPNPTVVTPAEPYIRTTAKFSNGNKEAYPSTSTTIIDIVTYGNLKVGTEYVLSGKLVSKKTGKTIAVNGKAVENKLSFTPSNTNGSIEMKFIFDTSSISTEYEIVVFERLTLADGELVAEHEDITDANQTVKIVVQNNSGTPNKDTTPNTPNKPNNSHTVQTGDGYTIIVVMFVGTIILLGAAILILRKKDN